jgi:hypothetical protein
MADFSLRVDRGLSQTDAIEKQFRALTERMRRALARERSIPGGWQTSVPRVQLSLAINQLALDANQIHISVQTTRGQTDFALDGISRDTAEANAWCHGATPASLNSACQQFSDAERSFEQHVVMLRAARTRLDAVWTSERREQDALVEAALDAAR